MKQIPYNNSAAPLHLEFPLEWRGVDITGVTLTIKDRDGVELLAADSLTLYTATVLDADAVRYTSSLALDSGADDLKEGDIILITGIEGAETHRVKGFDSTNKIVETEDIIENAHAAADDVYGLFGDIDVDTTDTAVFLPGLIVTLIWTPTGSGQPITELVQIAVTALDIVGLEKRFSRLYPRAFDAFKHPVDRLADMAQEAETQIRYELISNGLDIERIVNQEVITPAIMAKMAVLWTYNGDIEIEDERKFLLGEYDKQIGIIRNLPIWVDQDQDLIEDDGETTVHPHIFERAW